MIDDSDRLVLRRNVPARARREFDKGRSDPNLAMDRMILLLSRRAGAQEELEQLLASQQDPASLDYQRWLTPREFGERFGPSAEELALVTDWLASHGFRVDEVGKGRGWINFSGKAGDVEAAFGTEIHDYKVGGKLHHANAVDPSIPRGFAGLVNGIVSLNTFPRQTQIAGVRRVSQAEISPEFTNGGNHYLAPADFATIYNLNPSYNAGFDGTGQTIAIVGRTDINVADVQTFRSFFGLPVNDPVVVHNGPAPGNLGGGEEIEADLDVQWSGAVAPRATIKFVVSATTMSTDGVDLSAQYIVNNNLAPAMSTSFGQCEANMGATELSFYSSLWQQAAAQGITSFVATGDSGAAGCDPSNAAVGSGRAVSGLSTTPYNVAVGGTQFNDTGNPAAYWSSSNTPAGGSALSHIPEVAWNESAFGGGSGLLATGGGASNVYTKPSWQATTGVPGDGKRDVPDVSLAAAGHDGYLVYQGSCCFVVSGTSASSPSFAGLMALKVQKAGARFGNVNPLLYQLATSQYAGGVAVFHDVVSGNNTVTGVTGFSAGGGYDLATGLGSVDGTAFINTAAPAPLPSVSVGDVIVTEGNTGTTSAVFPVTLSQAAGAPVTVRYATANLSAGAPSDYVAISGTLTFPAGTTSLNVGVAVNGDTLYEENETFLLKLSSPVGAVIGNGQGQATIVNDDAPPTLSIHDPAPITEGNSGTKKVVFTVSLSNVSGAATTVNYFTADNTATVAGQDLIPISGGLTISAGKLSGTISVTIKGDANIEPDETFFVNLYGAVNATLVDGQGVGTILNDDFPGTIQFGAARFTVSEHAGFATIKVIRTGGSAAGTTVDYTTVDGSATQSADYTLTQGTLTFAGSATTAYFKVPVVKDAIHEGPETILLSLANAQPVAFGAAVGVQGTAVLTIVDDDIGGKVQLGATAYKVDASAGPTSVKVTVKRSGGLASPVTVHYATSGGTAVQSADYTNTFGDLTFLSSGIAATTQTFTIPILQNSSEAKTLTVALTAPMGGAVLGTMTVATVTILGAEPTVAFSNPAYSVKTTQPAALITVKRNAPLAGIVTLHYATSPGSAAAGGVDYSDVAGDLTFGPNVAIRTFTVPIAKDPFVDSQKTVMLALSGPTWTLNGTPGTAAVDPALGSATLTITDPNATPTVQFSAAKYTVNEATPKAVISVKRTGDLAGTVTVDYGGAAGGTAINGDPAIDPNADYTLLPGTLTFLPSKTVQTFTIPIVNDMVDEGTETVNLALTNPTWTDGTAVVGALGAALLNITDNEPTVQFSAAAYKAGEAAKAVTITVRRTGSLLDTATVGYAVTGGSATGGGIDYSLNPGILTFLPRQSTKTFPITLNPDTVSEGGETIDLGLNAPTFAQLGTPSAAVVTIKDNDVAGKAQFSATDYSVGEWEGAVTITVTRSGGTSSGATVGYATVLGGTAQDGTDYAAANGTLTFGPNEKTKTFPITILDDGVTNPGIVKTVLLTLGPGGNGLSLGTPSAATLWIVKD